MKSYAKVHKFNPSRNSSKKESRNGLPNLDWNPQGIKKEDVPKLPGGGPTKWKQPKKGRNQGVREWSIDLV